VKNNFTKHKEFFDITFYKLVINALTIYQNCCNFVTAYNYVTKCCRRL